MEIFGGSQGVNVIDVAEHTAGNSTGDKDKDTLLDTADTMQKVKEAGELETAATEALGKKPADFATAQENLEKAVELRPKDWELQQQLNLALIEKGELNKTKRLEDPTKLCKIGDIDKPTPAQQRCFKAAVRDRADAVEASIARQKARGGLVSCATYAELANAYDQFSRFTPADLILSYHFTQDDYEKRSDRYDHAKAMMQHPGQTCGTGAAAAPPA
jgi:hypothetical protein